MRWCILLIIICIQMLNLLQAVEVSSDNIRSITYYPDNSPNHIRLHRAERIQGFPCQNWVSFYPSGKLKSLDLADNYDYAGTSIPRLSRIHLYESGAIRSILFSRPTMVQGFLCVGYGVESPEISFWENGSLKTAYLKQSLIRRGIAIKPGSFSPVQLDSEGRLIAFTALRAGVYEGRRFSADSVLEFNARGDLISVHRAGWWRRLRNDILDLVL